MQKIHDNKSGQKRVIPVGINHFKAHISQVNSMPKQEKARGFDVIIGMDLLGKMIFYYSGNPAAPQGEMTIGF